MWHTQSTEFYIHYYIIYVNIKGEIDSVEILHNFLFREKHQFIFYLNIKGEIQCADG